MFINALKEISRRHKSEAGFTLVEVLTVMGIIAVLAAIAIPVYMNQTRSVKEAEIKSAVQTLMTTAINERTLNKEFRASVPDANIILGDKMKSGITLSSDKKRACVWVESIGEGAKRYHSTSDKTRATKGNCPAMG